MPKPRHRNLCQRQDAPLPAEKIEALPLVFDGVDRIICPWSCHAAMTPNDQARLLHVLDWIRQMRPTEPLWIWPERSRPEPVQNPDPRWLARYGEGKAVYRAGLVRRSG